MQHGCCSMEMDPLWLVADAVPVIIIADGNAPNKPEFDAIEKHSEARYLALAWHSDILYSYEHRRQEATLVQKRYWKHACGLCSYLLVHV